MTAAERRSQHLRAGWFSLALVFMSLAIARGATAAAPTTGQLLTPPGHRSQPVRMGVAMRIINIASIDEVNEQFEIDGFLLAGWTDPRLTYTRTGPEDDYREYTKGDVWIPYFEMVNGVSPHDRYDVSIQGAPDGSIRYIERFHAVLSSRFMLRRFPFDSQSLLIIIHPFVRQTGDINFFLSSRDVGAAREFAQYSSLAQWNFEGLDSWVGTANLYGHYQSAEARFTIRVKRRSDFYIWKVMLPLLLMVILSWSVFWVEARDLSNQVQIAVTTILTVIAFAFAISATMPRVPYLTYIDAFFLTCYVFVFLAIVELMAVHLSHRRDRATDLGLRIQRISRWAIPAAFLVTNLILIEHFLD
jgi:hypothetical protein